MKRYMTGLLLVLLIFSGCSLDWYTEDFEYWTRLEDEVRNMWEVFDWTSGEITYVLDNRDYNYFKTPKQIQETKEGECGEFATMAAYRCYEELGIEDSYVVVLIHPTKMVGDKRLGHVIVRIEGELYEPQWNGQQNQDRENLEDWLSIWEFSYEFHIKDFLYSIVHIHEYYGLLVWEEINNSIRDLAFIPAPSPDEVRAKK